MMIFLIACFCWMELASSDSSFSDDAADYPGLPQHGKCVPITIPLCDKLQYNTTMMPNLLGHQTQEDAGLEVAQYTPLVKKQCSPDLQIFLCTLYAPVCTILEKPIPPCRSLCQSARKGCEPVVMRFGFQWPKHLECSSFPVKDEPRVLCVGDDEMENSATNSPSPSPTISDYSDDPENSLPCPGQLQTSNKDYSITVSGKTADKCGFPCEEGKHFFTVMELWVARCFILAIAVCSACLSIVTILTFLIDLERFPYPGRCILYLLFSCLGLSIVHICGFFMKNEGACTGDLITQGNDTGKCTVMALFYYFFLWSLFLWYVILSVTWYLSAARDWVPEALKSINYIFFLIGYALPAALSIIVLIKKPTEGDVLSGICSIGVFKPEAKLYYLLIPLG